MDFSVTFHQTPRSKNLISVINHFCTSIIHLEVAFRQNANKVKQIIANQRRAVFKRTNKPLSTDIFVEVPFLGRALSPDTSQSFLAACGG